MSFEPNNNDDGRLPDYRQMPEEPVQAAPLPYYSMLMTAALAIVFVMQLNAGLVEQRCAHARAFGAAAKMSAVPMATCWIPSPL